VLIAQFCGCYMHCVRAAVDVDVDSLLDIVYLTERSLCHFEVIIIIIIIK